ncbi:hypothetical protein BHE74_00008682 [Ensete ventricosum]|uniref:Uncharacterized protein n=1 Tax=Ensete ventricosum TaxID=4639 RepID=A0A427BAZ6_ENSVE|nr:hypothetical protein B296_00009375 [Ensete ventricosum]RWW10894.1 hypothetical protein GW17_00025534 [Ensete ventricosum]RWW82834.1 hypothetical protein BHE74_00008682 [Ensete ventricosum]
MASAFAVTMAMPGVGRSRPLAGSDAFFQPLKLPVRRPTPAAAGRWRPRSQLKVRASSAKEKAMSGLATAALAAALLIPDVAEAAQPGVSPSLKNFLLSIVAGGVVLVVIVGAVVAVANFDPVKRS